MLNIDLDFELGSDEHKHGETNIELRIRSLNIVLNIHMALHSEFEFSGEYRPGEPNIDLYIRLLNKVLNIDLER